MKIARNELQKLILRVIKEHIIKPKNPFDYLDAEDALSIETFYGDADEEFQEDRYALATSLQKTKPHPYQPDPENYSNIDWGYEGYDYLQDEYDYDNHVTLYKMMISSPGFGKTQSEIDAIVDMFFMMDPEGFDGAMTFGGMTVRDIAEDLSDFSGDIIDDVFSNYPDIARKFDDYLSSLSDEEKQTNSLYQDVINKFEQSLMRPNIYRHLN